MLNTRENKIKLSCGTHDGTFHADEVTACALLVVFKLIDKEKIIRTRNPELLKQCEFVCDVGGIYDPTKKLFDHHQSEYQGQLSSAGMILLHLKNNGVISEGLYNFFNQSLILGVDAHDNGRDPQIPGLCTYSHIISNFTPLQYIVDATQHNSAFFEALDFAIQHLTKLGARYEYIQSCRQIIADVMNKSTDCLLFDEGIPWLETFFELNGEHHPAKFVIMPSGSSWKLRAIPPSLENRMKVRYPLPAEWAGLLEKDLERISGIPGAIFCHKGRFISVWKSREAAIEALNYTLKKLGEIAR